jgi:TolB protein
MNPDGTNVTQLTVGGILNLWPVWAPGGKQIAFNGVDGINVMNADGTNRTLIAPGNDIEALPFWSDDGKYIVFNQDVGGNREIFVMNADGTNMTRLTFSQGTDVAVAWRR